MTSIISEFYIYNAESSKLNVVSNLSPHVTLSPDKVYLFFTKDNFPLKINWVDLYNFVSHSSLKYFLEPI